jgi:hypothetical protein
MAWVHAGQILNGLSGPLVGGSCSAVAACWFAPSERTMATSIAYGVCALGPAVGFAAAVVVQTTADFEYLLSIEAAWSVVGALLWVALPALPAVPPSASAGRRQGGAGQQSEHTKLEAGFAEECQRVCQDPSFVRLVLAGGISFGVFQCWASVHKQPPVLMAIDGRACNCILTDYVWLIAGLRSPMRCRSALRKSQRTAAQERPMTM